MAALFGVGPRGCYRPSKGVITEFVLGVLRQHLMAQERLKGVALNMARDKLKTMYRAAELIAHALAGPAEAHRVANAHIAGEIIMPHVRLNFDAVDEDPEATRLVAQASDRHVAPLANRHVCRRADVERVGRPPHSQSHVNSAVGCKSDLHTFAV